MANKTVPNESSTETVERFIAAARAALPQHTIERWQLRSFGGSAQLADALIALIETGEKTGTFSLESEFEGRPDLRPVQGGYVVVTEFQGPPRLLYRLTEVETVAFEDIGPRHVAVEGPKARDVEIWRKIHWPYWGAMLEARGQVPTLHMSVLFQRFELLFTQRL